MIKNCLLFYKVMVVQQDISISWLEDICNIYIRKFVDTSLMFQMKAKRLDLCTKLTFVSARFFEQLGIFNGFVQKWLLWYAMHYPFMYKHVHSNTLEFGQCRLPTCDVLDHLMGITA